ncbi:hypothetical protein [Sphingomonas morindae]|uniref:Uncharacterized protein n=1 Tax=Sphingomonas morindae TaxID=1541170 RepID=A0ABY4X5S8_9SPHN|nr:hypothetical protein [Sphingomonas morindae]USI72215.1 hypothetical protein LHA26_13035 [Sphingomonas morindae]
MVRIAQADFASLPRRPIGCVKTYPRPLGVMAPLGAGYDNPVQRSPRGCLRVSAGETISFSAHGVDLVILYNRLAIRLPMEGGGRREMSMEAGHIINLNAQYIVRVLPGRNRCLVLNDPRRGLLVFKRNSGGRYSSLISEEMRRWRDISNVLVSRIISETFNVNTIVYTCANLLTDQKEVLTGVASAFVSNLRRLQPGDINAFATAQTMLRHALILAWMGDLDRVANPGNEGMTETGTYITLDYDLAFHEGVTFWGHPLISRAVTTALTQGFDVSAIIDEIGAYSAADIRRFVSHAGKTWIPDWSATLEDRATSVLCANQAAIVKSAAYRRLGAETNCLVGGTQRFVARFHQALLIPRRLSNLLTNQGVRPTLLKLVHRHGSPVDRSTMLLRRAEALAADASRSIAPLPYASRMRSVSSTLLDASANSARYVGDVASS